MLGLIKKDILMTKGNLKVLFIIFSVFALMSINGNGNFAFIPAFMSVMIVMSTFSYDEYNKTDAYITTLPNGKKNSVKAKYISTIIIILICTLLMSLMTVGIGIFENNLNIKEILYTSIGTCCGVIIFQSLIYPPIYKFGIEKSRIGIFLVVFAIAGIASLLLKNGSNIRTPRNITLFINNYWIILLPLIVLIIIFISYKISEHIYIKKEF